MAALSSATQDSIVYRIDRRSAVKIEDLTFGMLAVGAEYEKFVRSEHPKMDDAESNLYITKISEGSILIEMIGAMAPLFQGMNNVVVFKQFLEAIGVKFDALSLPNGRLEKTSTKELENLARIAQTIVDDPNANAEFLAYEYSDKTNSREVKARVILKARNSEKIIANAREQISEIKGEESSIHNGVLMRLYQTNIARASADRASGEKGIVESISPDPKRLIYASDLAGQKIKSAWNEDAISPYDLGFVVDIDIQMINGVPRAYRILEVHDIFNLDDE